MTTTNVPDERSLTPCQRTIVRELQKVGTMKVKSGWMMKAYKNLLNKGVVRRVEDSEITNVFELTEAWKDLPKRQIIPREKVIIGPPIAPDPPKKKIVRPPKEYSNGPSWEERIDQILNS